MGKDRMLAFSDGVLAIIITIMALELRPPHEVTLEGLREVVPVFLSYVLSFLYIAIYWNNHHHMLATVDHVNGGILWANMHLLFWLSLIPFTTSWLGRATAPGGPRSSTESRCWRRRSLTTFCRPYSSALTRLITSSRARLVGTGRGRSRRRSTSSASRFALSSHASVTPSLCWWP